MKDWNSYFMEIAEVVKSRSGCTRRQVGAVFVRDKRVLCMGYNQAPSGVAHCDEGGCTMYDGHCIRAIHAELNGILNATKAGQSLENSDVYITSFPCLRCAMALRNAGIKKIWYKEPYKYRKHELELGNEVLGHFWLEQWGGDEHKDNAEQEGDSDTSGHDEKP